MNQISLLRKAYLLTTQQKLDHYIEKKGEFPSSHLPNP